MGRYLTHPVEVEARQWLPDDPQQAGALIGWLDACGVANDILRGFGESAVLGIGLRYGQVDAVVELRPGDWVIRHDDGMIQTAAAANFTAEHTAVPDPAGTVVMARHGDDLGVQTIRDDYCVVTDGTALLAHSTVHNDGATHVLSFKGVRRG